MNVNINYIPRSAIADIAKDVFYETHAMQRQGHLQQTIENASFCVNEASNYLFIYLFICFSESLKQQIKIASQFFLVLQMIKSQIRSVEDIILTNYNEILVHKLSQIENRIIKMTTRALGNGMKFGGVTY